MSVPDKLLALVGSFARNQADCLSPHYRETQLRREFLDPCFELLGWDVDNKQGLGASLREVVHEDVLRTGSGIKAPDYSFRIAGVRKFFVEAKRPAVQVARDPASAYQLRRYAWSANLPVSVLTDFQEWAIYDCRRRPSPQDTAAVGRWDYFTFDQLESKWAELVDVLSKPRVIDGSLDRFATTGTRTGKMAEVDEAFLSEIEGWRLLLAQDIAKRNKRLSADDLSLAVQLIIDRIIFLRICEARGIEDLYQLRDLASTKNIYPELLDTFYRADSRYNSGLFHFHDERGRGDADMLAPTLAVADDVLTQIITHLYYPTSPYEFAVLPSRILGQAYERSLGSEVRLSASRDVTIELKPEVARAGGVFYTPAYIADRIIERTIGQLLDAKSRTARSDAASLRILDPACGSGSFLLSAYDYLLSWYRDFYVSRAGKHKKELYKSTSGEWRLTIAERKRILTAHIFGVDIDPEAAEMTKLSLLLKVLEGENADTVAQQLVLWHERALPDIDANIQCGNSLCESDFTSWVASSGEDGSDVLGKVRAFDWQSAFPAIFGRDNPGFDVVVGNPPYISALTMVGTLRPEIKDYWKERYESAAGAYDMYVLFIEQALRLSRQGGLVSFIIPNKFLAAEYARSFRAMIARDTRFLELVDYSRTRPWKRGVYPVVPLLVKSAPKRTDKLSVLVGDPDRKEVVHEFGTVSREVLVNMPDNLWSFVSQSGVETLGRILQRSVALEDLADINGSSTVAEGSEFPMLMRSLGNRERPTKDEARLLITGSIRRHCHVWETKTITYMRASYSRPVLRLDKPLSERRIAQIRSPKIILAKVSKAPKGFVDYNGDYAAAYCTYVFPHDNVSSAALTGIINSKLMHFASRLMYDALAMSGGYISFQPPQIRRLPICSMKDESMILKLEDLVREIEETSFALNVVQLASDRAELESRRRSTEQQLDTLVVSIR